jgi:hypothetical protein
MSSINCISGMPVTVASGNVVAETAFGLAASSATRASLDMPAWVTNDVLDGREFVLRLGVLVTTGGSITWRPGIRFYQTTANTNLTTFNANDTLIINPTAPTIATTTLLTRIVARCMWDKTTGRLGGSYLFEIDNTFTAEAALTAGITANAGTATLLRFFPTGIFGTTQASNTAVVKYFEMDVV